jgi:hypothetical protein
MSDLKSVERPAALASQNVEDFAEYFRDQRDLTFVFTASERGGEHAANDVSPDLVSALKLARCAYAGEEYKPPGSPVPATVRSGARRAETLHGVALRVKEMARREDTSFILAWHLRGDTAAHLDVSREWAWEGIREELISALEEALYTYFD